jgi:hypothetical protein
MGGLVCCASDRKEGLNPTTFQPLNRSYHQASPGKSTSDSDNIWEMNE